MAATSEESRLAMQVGEAIGSFAFEGSFPDETQSSLPIASINHEAAIQALAKHKTDLEAQIHTINEETKGDVSSWVSNAKKLQEDILRSKRMCDDIVRQSEAPDVSGKAIEEIEERTDFLRREVTYSEQLYEVLKGIRQVNELLSEVEQAMNDRRVLDALRWLEKSWAEMDTIPVSKSRRIMRLLDVRAFELKSSVHDVFSHVWNSLVQVDREARSISIHNKREGEQMTLSEAVIGLEAYKEVEHRMAKLWQDLDEAIVSPCMDMEASSLPGIQPGENSLQVQGETGQSLDDLFSHLQKVVEFLASSLPPDLLIYLSPIMMSDIVPRLVNVWLDAAVPSNLNDIDQFRDVIASAKRFCDVLEQNGFTGFTELKEWVGSAPSIWLAKCRETALESVRSRLSQGLGDSKQVEKVEKQMVSRSEGKELAANGVVDARADDDDWGAAWGDDDVPGPEENAKKTAPTSNQDDGADAWGWDDDEQTAENDDSAPVKSVEEDDDEDDPAAAWGWGDDDPAGAPAASPVAAKKKPQQTTFTEAPEESREMVLKETYHISSLPEPVLDLILALLEDGAALTQPTMVDSPVAAAAPGLFGLPTFALAMFRAISPSYYALQMGGNMFLYNDAMYMAEKLTDLAATWKARDDLTPRARNMLRIDNDIKGLQGFANRAYTGELGMQRTVIRDLLGGDQNVMQQDDAESCIDAAAAHIRSVAATWDAILARSVWNQAVGSLVDSASNKIISDVMDMSSIGQEEAYQIAKIIARATELDSLFLPSRGQAIAAAGGAGAGSEEDEIPSTAQYAGSWLRLKYLSEVLQSNLNEVKYLWCESELSLYFSVEEVVDLIEASFEANARTKGTIREIRENPSPMGM